MRVVFLKAKHSHCVRYCNCPDGGETRLSTTWYPEVPCSLRAAQTADAKKRIVRLFSRLDYGWLWILCWKQRYIITTGYSHKSLQVSALTGYLPFFWILTFDSIVLVTFSLRTDNSMFSLCTRSPNIRTVVVNCPSQEDGQKILGSFWMFQFQFCQEKSDIDIFWLKNIITYLV